MRRKITISVFAVAVFAVAVVAARPYIHFYMLTGHFLPLKHLETLSAPVKVKGWDSNGLLLADGRRVTLPGLRKLPRQSAALTEVTKHGVEMTGGRVYGLVKVHHWCGNDPMREHVARVDVADMLTFLRVGEPVGPVPNAEYLYPEAGGTFSEAGWEVGQFGVFQSWQSLKHSAQ